MDGLFVYSKYLNNVNSVIQGYTLPECGRTYNSIFKVSGELEDLSYLDTVLQTVNPDLLFIKTKTFLDMPIYYDMDNTELYLGGMSEVFIEDLTEEEKSDIVEYCGDLADEDADINYLNISISSLNFGEEKEKSSFDLMQERQDEIQKMFTSMREKKDELVVDDEDIEGEIEGYDEEGEDEEEDDSVLEFDEEEDSEDIEEKESVLNEEDIEEDIEEDTGLYKYTEDEIVIDDEDADFFLNDTEAVQMPKVEEKAYKKKEKLINNEYVTDVDDALAKTLLAINDNIFKIPNRTLDIAGKVKEKGKKICETLKVEDEEQ